jgi:hypothetical protein
MFKTNQNNKYKYDLYLYNKCFLLFLNNSILYSLFILLSIYKLQNFFIFIIFSILFTIISFFIYYYYILQKNNKYIIYKKISII